MLIFQALEGYRVLYGILSTGVARAKWKGLLTDLGRAWIERASSSSLQPTAQPF